ncbi:sialic acid-binding Ig-like lectin 12 [Nothobranchius furzeri]|uniref:sialic acid-binding Ig-like lectin 12 n=1 Tax=Nothobranchius furzeri TaxID=105023 RepID=UPI003904B1D2
MTKTSGNTGGGGGGGTGQRRNRNFTMFVLIWATLLFSVRGIVANSEASVRRTWHCQSDYCVNLYENINAEAGLCVEISCSFTTSSDFNPAHLVWYKCESSKSKCGDSDIIFHIYKNKIQSGFRGRVSLLEPRLHHGNCSIIISDLQESDSGSYQLRVNGYLNGEGTGFTYNTRTTVHVRALKQKPTLVVPPLTEGQQTTLTCTAPGLCPGSPPNITWRWRGEEEEDFTITRDITAVTQRHSSTLTFNPSAEHHDTNITCKISFTGDTTTEETVTLNVTYVNKLRVDGETSVKEGETLNRTCSGESFPQGQGSAPWAVAAASLSVNVLCLICMLLLWNKNKKVKPNQDDRTYVSLQKVDTSPEYDVIVRQ